MTDHTFPSSLLRSRRRFLNQALVASAGATWMAACSRGGNLDSSGSTLAPTSSSAPETSSQGELTAGAVSGRVLVVVNLDGGNDGLSTVVPHGDGRYYDLRPELAVEDVNEIDDRIGLHPRLSRLHQRGVITVEGVGPVDGNLSHFEMAARWQRGDVRGQENQHSGFLGRLTDALDEGSALTGVSIAGPTPHLVNDRAATLALSGMEALWFLEPTDWAEATAYQEFIRSFAPVKGSGAGASQVNGAMITQSYGRLLDLAAKLSGVESEEEDWEQPMLAEGGELGQQLSLAADLLAADVGTRVIYTELSGFDTHDDHQWQHPELMGQVDAAIDGFLGKVDDLGMGEQILVATTSEFGRRVGQNGAGLDHGAASSMLLAGPIPVQQLGSAPDLGDLDDDGNLRTTVPFDRYLATLAEGWLGVAAASVLPDAPEPLATF